MENNLVELKYDKVNEYFEKFKKKYTNDYEENKVRGVKIVRNYYSFVSSLNHLYLSSYFNLWFYFTRHCF